MPPSHARAALLATASFAATIAICSAQDPGRRDAPSPKTKENGSLRGPSRAIQTLAPGLVLRRYGHRKKRQDFSGLRNAFRSLAETITINVLTIDPELFDLRVLDAAAYAPGRCSVKFLTKASGALACINGGYYDVDDRPMGLHVRHGVRFQKFRWGRRKHGGIFYRRRGRYTIISGGTYLRYYVKARPPSPMMEAMECFPLLVAGGRPLPRWRSGVKIAARSAVGIDGKGKIHLAVTENELLNGLPLAEFAHFMAKKVRCRLALNLDGGPSSQLYAAHGGVEFSVDGRSGIRTALAVFPRGQKPRPDTLPASGW